MAVTEACIQVAAVGVHLWPMRSAGVDVGNLARRAVGHLHAQFRIHSRLGKRHQDLLVSEGIAMGATAQMFWVQFIIQMKQGAGEKILNWCWSEFVDACEDEMAAKHRTNPTCLTE